MTTRRLAELLLVVVACGFGGLWCGRREAPTENLTALSYGAWPFQYSLEVKPNGAGRFNASFACVGATSEPGRVGCQHAEGGVTSAQARNLWSRLRQAGADRILATPGAMFRGPGMGEAPGLRIEYGGRWLEIALPAESVIAALEQSHPGEIRRRLEAEREKAERSLKNR